MGKKVKTIKGVTVAASPNAPCRLNEVGNVFTKGKATTELVASVGAISRPVATGVDPNGVAFHPDGLLVTSYDNVTLYGEEGKERWVRRKKNEECFSRSGAFYDPLAGQLVTSVTGGVAAYTPKGKSRDWYAPDGTRVMAIVKLGDGVAVGTDNGVFLLDANLEVCARHDFSLQYPVCFVSNAEKTKLAFYTGESLIVTDEKLATIATLQSSWFFCWCGTDGLIWYDFEQPGLYHHDIDTNNCNLCVALEESPSCLFGGAGDEWGYAVNEAGAVVYGSDGQIRRRVHFTSKDDPSMHMGPTGELSICIDGSRGKDILRAPAKAFPILRRIETARRKTSTTEEPFESQSEVESALRVERERLEEEGFVFHGWRLKEVDFSVSAQGSRVTVTGPSSRSCTLEYLEKSREEEQESWHPRIEVELRMDGHDSPVAYAYAHGSYDGNDNVVVESCHFEETLLVEMLATLGTTSDWATVLEAIAKSVPYPDGLLQAINYRMEVNSLTTFCVC